MWQRTCCVEILFKECPRSVVKKRMTVLMRYRALNRASASLSICKTISLTSVVSLRPSRASQPWRARRDTSGEQLPGAKQPTATRYFMRWKISNSANPGSSATTLNSHQVHVTVYLSRTFRLQTCLHYLKLKEAVGAEDQMMLCTLFTKRMALVGRNVTIATE